MQSIQLENICKTFGGTKALTGVSCEVAGGERLVVIGGSGAGKTTLLRIIAGLEVADSGSVKIGDRDLASVPAHQRGVAFLSQDYAVYPQLSVTKNLQVALEPLKLGRSEVASRIDEAIAWFRLSDLCHRRPAQLSGGQLQRVAFAKAIVRRPAVLVLDEPFSQLDPILREASRQLIQTTTAKFRMTLVMVTHDPMDALRLADKIAVLENGRVVQSGAPESVYQSPCSLHVAEMLSPLGVNELRLPAGSLLFRPECASLQPTKFHDTAPESSSEARLLETSYSGVLQQVQSLGFGQLVYVATAISGNPQSDEQGPQVVKILISSSTKLPPLGSPVRFTIQQLLSLSTLPAA